MANWFCCEIFIRQNSCARYSNRTMTRHSFAPKLLSCVIVIVLIEVYFFGPSVSGGDRNGKQCCQHTVTTTKCWWVFFADSGMFSCRCILLRFLFYSILLCLVFEYKSWNIYIYILYTSTTFCWKFYTTEIPVVPTHNIKG